MRQVAPFGGSMDICVLGVLPCHVAVLGELGLGACPPFPNTVGGEWATAVDRCVSSLVS